MEVDRGVAPIAPTACRAMVLKDSTPTVPESKPEHVNGARVAQEIGDTYRNLFTRKSRQWRDTRSQRRQLAQRNGEAPAASCLNGRERRALGEGN